MKIFLHKIIENRFLSTLFFVFFLIILGVIDFLTGYEFSFQFFYFVPLAVVSFNIKYSRFHIVFFALITSIVWLVADFLSLHVYSSNYFYIWNTFSRFVVFGAFTLFLHSLIKHRTEIDFLNKELSDKDFLFTESIKYAKTIQDSIVPPFDKFKLHFKDSFLLNKPKAILSGDFFWYHKISDNTFFALVDCTGHGVPGSLLSIIGNILLERIIIEKQIISTSEILKKMHEDLVRIFSIGGEISDDGMEICLIKYNEQKSEITISQTSQSAILVSKDGSLKEFDNHGHTVGGLISKRNGGFYSDETFPVSKGKVLYLFSDGYIDQFGSDENIKYGNLNFLNLIQSVSHLSTNEQFVIFSDTINKWKGNKSQIDDITLVGIKF